MKCYVPTWFDIKCRESIVDGSRNLFGLVQRYKSVDTTTQDIVHPTIQRNAYFAHPECILLAMLADENESLRKLAHMLGFSKLEQTLLTP